MKGRKMGGGEVKLLSKNKKENFLKNGHCFSPKTKGKGLALWLYHNKIIFVSIKLKCYYSPK